jgi:hypothetical protein
MRESVLNGVTVSGVSGGFSAADAAQVDPMRTTAASAVPKQRRIGCQQILWCNFMTGLDLREIQERLNGQRERNGRNGAGEVPTPLSGRPEIVVGVTIRRLHGSPPFINHGHNPHRAVS